MKAESSNKSLANTIALLGILGTIGIVSTLSTFTTSVLAAETSGSVKLSAGVGESISMLITGNADGTDCTNAGFNSCSTFGNLLPNQYATASSLISVYTNSVGGYSLSVKADNHADLQTESGSSIPAGTLTGETGGQGIWSYKTDGTGIKTNWTSMTTTDTTIKGTSVYSAATSDTTVTYGLSTSNNQAAGDYSTTLIYTATASNSTEVVEQTAPLTVNLNEGMYGVQIKTSTLDGESLALVTEDGSTVNITMGQSYYIIPLYNSGYTLDSITADGGTVTVGTNGYYYYKSTNSTTNEVTLTGKTLTSALTDSSLPAMQTLTSANCPAIPTAVQDSRDNSVYYVQKLADGNCWMLENLRLGGSSTMELNSSNTNLAANTTFTLPASGTANFTNNTAGYTTAAMNADSKETLVTGYGAGRSLVGNYYNYCATSAETICTTSNANDDEFNVCPANWTMPSGGPDGQYGQLATILDPTNINTDLTDDPATTYRYHLSTPLSGSFFSGQTSNQGTRGSFWSTTQPSNYAAYMNGLYVNTSTVSPRTSGSNRLFGLIIRCILQ